MMSILRFRKMPLFEDRWTNWNELLERLEQAGIAAQNVAIEHFVDLLHAWFDFKQILFTEEDMKVLQDKAFPTQLVKLIELITEVGNKFPKSFKPEADYDESCIGYYVKDKNGEYVLWFGCGFKYWRDHGSFFQIGVGDDKDQDFSQAVIGRFREKFGEDTWYEPWEWYIAPIPLTLIEDPQNVKKIVRFIADTAAFCGGPEETV